MNNQNTPEKKSLRQIREEATLRAKQQAVKEANNPILKKSMDDFRAKEAEFFAAQR